ncbi:hypothetical protein IE81DRAFT_253937 [Ceraceosorus guamensis]|uniref:Uncharacterized protein n=1 Tax=Ceraceosorus guamensis TaxID=1522189 RepID=A0A316WAS8_9BASI|nr:hypothetical protein IE81DRAFT_253937 [Ceraceosorus guamensis]PWN44745.1 hypothetical protein IE81DRAFT_253937 [Ceraceosorus guamensis]
MYRPLVIGGLASCLLRSLALYLTLSRIWIPRRGWTGSRRLMDRNPNRSLCQARVYSQKRLLSDGQTSASRRIAVMLSMPRTRTASTASGIVSHFAETRPGTPPFLLAQSASSARHCTPTLGQSADPPSCGVVAFSPASIDTLLLLLLWSITRQRCSDARGMHPRKSAAHVAFLAQKCQTCE